RWFYGKTAPKRSFLLRPISASLPLARESHGPARNHRVGTPSQHRQGHRLMAFHNGQGPHQTPAPLPPTTRVVRYYCLTSTPGRTGVPSFWTPSRSLGGSPRACRIVGATWVVSTKLVTVLAWRPGCDTSSITLISSWAKPPCSACFFALPV